METYGFINSPTVCILHNLATSTSSLSGSLGDIDRAIAIVPHDEATATSSVPPITLYSSPDQSAGFALIPSPRSILSRRSWILTSKRVTQDSKRISWSGGSRINRIHLWMWLFPAQQRLQPWEALMAAVQLVWSTTTNPTPKDVILGNLGNAGAVAPSDPCRAMARLTRVSNVELLDTSFFKSPCNVTLQGARSRR